MVRGGEGGAVEGRFKTRAWALPTPGPPAPASLQRRNFEFFITVAMGVDNRLEQPTGIDFVVVQSGDTCTPCARLGPLLR